MSDILERAGRQFTSCCVQELRYRVAWLIGAPQQSHKTILATQLCKQHGWHYLDYTLTPGHFDVLADTIAHYQPQEFTQAITEWCQHCRYPVLVLDEIDALLATWDASQRRIWVGLTARLQYLPCGLILVSHFFTQTQLIEYLPDHDPRYCFNASGAVV